MKSCFSLVAAIVVVLTIASGGRVGAQPALTNSVLFNGSNGFVNVLNVGNILPTNEVTVEFWAYTTKLAAQAVFGLSPDQVTNRFFGYVNYADGATYGDTYWDFGNPSGNGRLGGVPAPVNSLNHWVHYALVSSQSGNAMLLYTNGSLARSKTGMTPWMPGNYNLQIGGPGSPYHGRLSEFRVWNVARTQPQIQSDLAAPLTGNEAGLVLYYRFNNTNGYVATNLASSTGTAYNGTINYTRTVTNVNDSGPGSLRQTIANATSGDTIYFATNLSGKTIVLTNGELAFNQSLTLDASSLPGRLMLDGRHTGRIFNVAASSTSVITGLVITNGLGSGAPLPGYGGGVFNAGNLTLLNCSLVGSSAFAGGAAYNSGNLVLNNSTVSGNSANYGGGIQNEQNLFATNCTFAGNSASVNGGAINATFGRPLNLNACSISANSCAIGAGVNVIGSGSTINNTIVAGNLGGNNIDGDAFAGGNNLTSGAPLLAALGNYGGLTQTMPPLAGSPAIDAGGGTSLTTDQRGLRRIVGATNDIGAVEFQDASPLVVNNSDAGIGSLRYALTYCPVGARITFTNTLSGADISLISGEIPINQNATVDASSLSNGLVIDGSHSSRIFEVQSGATVVLSSLTLTDGFDSSGGGGGAIKNSGTLTVNRCSLFGNTATNLGGGAIFHSTGTLTLNESTVFGNTANNGYGGGGILVFYGSVAVNQSTLTGNTSTNNQYGGGCILNAANVSVSNSIVAGNFGNGGSDIANYSTISRMGANIIQSEVEYGGVSSGPAAINAAPWLAPLGNYGGPTPTMPPLSPGSPAVDACTRGTVFTTDQRGFPRVVGARADIGAVEVQAASSTTPTNIVTAPTNGQLWSNLVFTATGTARDNAAVSNVLYSLNGADWLPATSSNNWANWTVPLNLTPGTNTFATFALDFSGNISALTTVKLIYVVSSPLTVMVNGPGTISPASYSNIVLQVGRGYSVTGTPTQTGFALKNWTDGSSNVVSTAATYPFLMTSNLSLTANFVDVQIPTVAITNVPAVLNLSNGQFTVSGRAGDNVVVTNVSVRLNGGAWATANLANNFVNWSADLNLVPGTNVIAAYAVDSTGNHSLTNTVKVFYAVTSTLTVAINGPGTISPASYTNISLALGRSYTLTGTPGQTGFALTNWTQGGTVIGNKPTLSFIMSSNLALAVNFVDIAKPTLTITTPTTATSATNESYLATGKAADNAAVTNVLYKLNNLDWTAISSANGWSNWSVALNLTPGTNYFSAYALDSSGNASLTNTVKFLYTTAPTSLSGLAAQVTPDGGTAFGVGFGATTFNQLSADTNNPNAVGNYTYTKQTPSSGLLKLTYTAPPSATNEGLQTINLTFTSSSMARFVNGVDTGGITFTSTPTLAPSAIASQTVYVMDAANGTGSEGQSIVFAANQYVSSNLVTLATKTNLGYTYATYGPVGALLKHTDTNGQTYALFNFYGTNFGTVHLEKYNAAGAYVDSSDRDFAFASQRAGGNAPTNLIGRSLTYYNDGFYSRLAFPDATTFTLGTTLNLIGDYIAPLNSGSYVYQQSGPNTAGLSLTQVGGSGSYSYEFIAPNFAYITFPSGGFILGVLLK